MTKTAETFGAEASHSGPMARVNFERPLSCVMGLPVDAIRMPVAVQLIRAAAMGNTRCFVSTPNLNFALTARHNTEFRRSVMRSDLSLVDGMPLILVGRLLGLPLPERVSGADVFEALLAHPGPPVTVFLFGGPPGAGAMASHEINQRGGGVRCVGFDGAGFGSVESMSSEEQIARINRSGAQFVIAALGAVKGQAWLEHNAQRLTAPVLAHLGAVVNFAAGTVKRAPRWVQSCGLEWAWRIKEEPQLWRRYWGDGLGFAGLLATRVLPLALDIAFGRMAMGWGRKPDPRLEVARTTGGHQLRLVGDWRDDRSMAALRAAIARCADDNRVLTVDMQGVSALGAGLTALLLVSKGWFSVHGSFELTGVSKLVRKSMRQWLVADELLGDGA